LAAQYEQEVKELADAGVPEEKVIKCEMAGAKLPDDNDVGLNRTHNNNNAFACLIK
jgi:hypothetical protein